MAFPGAVPASMGKRLLAAVIDAAAGLVLGGGFVVAGALSLTRGLQDPSGGTAAPGVPPMLVVGCGLLLGLAVVQWWLLGSRGWTIGKRLVSLRVLSPDTGRPVGPGKALVRFLVPAAGSLALGIGQLVVHLSPFFDSSGRRQGWHDKVAGTMVFDTAVGIDPSSVPAHVTIRRVDELLRGPAVTTGVPTPPPSMAAAPAPAPGPAHALAPAAPPAPAPGPAAASAGAGAQVPEPSAAIISGVPRAWSSHDPAAAPHAIDQTQVISRRALRAGALPADAPAPAAPPEAQQPLAPQPVAQQPVAQQPVAPQPVAPQPVAAPGVAPQPESPAGASVTGAARVVPSASLPDEVERTRLRPARGKVPQMASAAPRATIELSDGRRVTLERTALIGRSPAPRPGDADVELIEVPDPGRSVSKTHLAIGVDRSGVWVRDRDSTNGTVVTLADGQQILCAAEQQVRLPAGASVAFGDYALTIG